MKKPYWVRETEEPDAGWEEFCTECADGAVKAYGAWLVDIFPEHAEDLLSAYGISVEVQTSSGQTYPARVSAKRVLVFGSTHITEET